MRYVILFEDDPAKADVRPKLMPEHQKFLRAHGDRILTAGPLLEESGAGAGGMWLVEAASAAEARHLVEADPFWPTGLRKSVRILQWKLVFHAGQALV
ncbi:YciI family protein [Terrarubrum flagellatum]|uniref:YciI family protein n=1 Tax=Terrirubrum flagellatum TaxID=2895980 RepID=UPI0031451943